ncbi:hypothetical protein ACOSQ2_030526 [Xanthoceras sorbifolium]
MALKLVKRSKTSERSLNLPPGPWKLPIIGNLHQLTNPLIHRQLRDLAMKYGPLMHLQLGELSTVVVSSPKYAEEVMKTHDVIFASRPVLLSTKILDYDSTSISFSPYGSYWRQLRKICVQELLTMKRVQSFRPIREEEVSNLITSIASNAGSPVNLTEKFRTLIYGITSRAAFGKKSKDMEVFISAFMEALSLSAGFNISDLYPSIELLQWITGIRSQLERIHRTMDSILEDIVNEHKSKQTTPSKVGDLQSDENEDLVDVLLKIQERGDLEVPLTADNVKAVILDVWIAGGETSATTIDWIMSELLKNPLILKKAQAEVREVFNRIGKVDESGISEMKYLKLVVKETLRFHPPVPLLVPRESRERCEISGFNIPSKSQVIVNAWAISRDPEYWSEAEKFIPERFDDCPIDYKGTNFEFIPFGAGRRICPGSSYGVTNIELPLALLLYYFDWKLPNDMKNEDLDMTETAGLAVRRKNELYVIPIPYSSPSTA